MLPLFYTNYSRLTKHYHFEFSVFWYFREYNLISLLRSYNVLKEHFFSIVTKIFRSRNIPQQVQYQICAEFELQFLTDRISCNMHKKVNCTFGIRDFDCSFASHLTNNSIFHYYISFLHMSFPPEVA